LTFCRGCYVCCEPPHHPTLGRHQRRSPPLSPTTHPLSSPLVHHHLASNRRVAAATWSSLVGGDGSVKKRATNRSLHYIIMEGGSARDDEWGWVIVLPEKCGWQREHKYNDVSVDRGGDWFGLWREVNHIYLYFYDLIQVINFNSINMHLCVKSFPVMSSFPIEKSFWKFKEYVTSLKWYT
jgi:hypothetical protein